MVDQILEIFEYAGFGMFFAGIIALLINVVISFIISLRQTRWVRLAPYTRIVSEAILYTNDILAEKKIKQFPGYRIRYYRHKKYAGVFDGTVTVYMGSNPGISELVDTVLHEVQHYIQSQTDRQYKYYDKYTAERGYWDNPFEVECREFASRHRDACLRHLETKKLIKRA
ncbi:MAG TPA: hypothetical protein PLV06_14925 [Bacteroidales bacterium]|nr:hypothetical protein [Bacteroidales bacterium]